MRGRECSAGWADGCWHEVLQGGAQRAQRCAQRPAGPGAWRQAQQARQGVVLRHLLTLRPVPPLAQQQHGAAAAVPAEDGAQLGVRQMRGALVWRCDVWDSGQRRPAHASRRSPAPRPGRRAAHRHPAPPGPPALPPPCPPCTYGNPTTRVLEEKIAALEGAEDCVVSWQRRRRRRRRLPQRRAPRTRPQSSAVAPAGVLCGRCARSRPTAHLPADLAARRHAPRHAPAPGVGLRHGERVDDAAGAGAARRPHRDHNRLLPPHAPVHPDLPAAPGHRLHCDRPV